MVSLQMESARDPDTLECAAQVAATHAACTAGLRGWLQQFKCDQVFSAPGSWHGATLPDMEAASWQGATLLDEEGAEAFAVLLRMMRGVNAVGCTVAECRATTPAILLSIYKARVVHASQTR